MNTKRTNGIILVIVSAAVFSTAGIFTNGVETKAWDIIFWRGLAAAAFTFAYLIFRKSLLSEIRAFGWPALAVALMGAAGSAAFIPAFKLSSVANVTLIYAAAPFLTATLAWITINERPSRTVLIASCIAFFGVLIIFSGSIGGGNLLGDLLALWMTLMLAGIMIVYRKFPDTTAALPAALSSILLLPFAMLWGNPMSAPSGELPILILFGLVFAIASVTLSEGARRLPPSETALLSSLEVPLGPIFAYMILSEIPAQLTVIGGVIVFGAVLWSQTAKS